MNNQNDTKNSLLGTVLGTAVFGAIVGGTAAAAKGIRQIRNDEAGKEEIMINVAKEAGSTAVAAGTAGAIVGALRIGPVLSAMGIVAIATGTKYALDSVLEPACAGGSTAPKKHAPLIMDTPAAKETEGKPAAKKKADSKKTAAAKKTTAAKKAATKKAADLKTEKKTAAKSEPKTENAEKE